MLRETIRRAGDPMLAPPAGEADEAALLERVAAGDGRAFEALYRRYFPRLCRFLERMTRRPALVEEILNDTMLVVSHNAHKYRREARPSTWIFAIAYRKGLKALKRLDEPVEDDARAAAAQIEPGMQPNDELLRRQQRHLLASALEALPVKQRTVVELTYFQGADYREIARIMDCPVDTIKTRMFHARRQLKALLPERLEDIL